MASEARVRPVVAGFIAIKIGYPTGSIISDRGLRRPAVIGYRDQGSLLGYISDRSLLTCDTLAGVPPREIRERVSICFIFTIDSSTAPSRQGYHR
jgi:hypothetical protein